MSFEDFLHVKSTNMAAEKSREILSSNTLNAVREEYKRYKRRSKAPDFGDVIDFENPSTFSGRAVEVDVSNMPNEPLNCHSFGLVSPTNWKAFEVVSCPGFMFIINPFKKGFQHYMVQRLLKDFPRKPNATNLVVHKDIVLQDDESFWDYCMKSTRPDDINKLRWTHLGYQFDYNKEEYKSDAYFGFPQDLACLVTYIAATLGFHDYQPQSGVVNYYPLGSSMGGHVDRYENDLSQPLISISFGQSAIYLIGGKTCDIRPTALFVKSGDVIVMSGDSRLSYHAVPRIIKVGRVNEPPDCLKWVENANGSKMPLLKLLNEKSDKINNRCSVCKNYFDSRDVLKRLDSFSKNAEQWAPFASYCSRTRVNINVRQVHLASENIKLRFIS